MENQERQRRLFIIVAAAIVDALVVGVVVFFVWMSARGTSSGPALPTPTPETGESGSTALIWLPIVLALLMPLTSLPVILLLRRRASGGLQTPREIQATVVRRIISALGGTAQPSSPETPGELQDAPPANTGEGGQQNRTFILVIAAGGILLLGFLAFLAVMLSRP
jgi:hypothetical protein